MIITKKTIPRRMMLRGIGASLALPLLDAMVPAAVPLRKTAAKPVRRLGVVYVPNGMMMDHWTPVAEGTGFDFPTILEPLEPFRDSVQVLSGMRGKDAEGPHARASTRFLTGVVSKRDEGSSLRAGISMDQVAGRVLGRRTQLATLELGLDGRDFAGSCDEGFSCAYTNTISWANETTPLPMEINPRAVFERLFGDSGSTDPDVRRARLAKDASLLDSVTERASDLSRELGPSDRAKLIQYLEAVRDIERADSGGRAAERPRASRSRSTGGNPEHIRRARRADVRSARAGLRNGSHPCSHLYDGARDHGPHLPRDRRAGRPSSDLAPPKRSRKARKAEEDQPLPRGAVREVHRAIGLDARRRRDAAR